MSHSLTSKKMHWAGRALAIALLCAPLASLAADKGTLTLQKTATYEPNLDVPRAVKAECGLETKVVEFIQSYSADKGTFDKIELVDDATQGDTGKSLSLTITGLTGTGGGAWSGTKYLTVDGTLREGGFVTGTFRATRLSDGGAFGAYKGTCAILGRCAKAIGNDISKWLAKKPKMNSKLGDAK